LLAPRPTPQAGGPPLVGCPRLLIQYVRSYFLYCGPGSVVGIATDYGLDGLGIESRGGAIFSAPVQTSPGAHPVSCTMGTGSSPVGKERPGPDADFSSPSSAVGHERVELYLYSPYGPYGLYRTSVPVQGCTLPYLYLLGRFEKTKPFIVDSLLEYKEDMLIATYYSSWSRYCYNS